ncbi:pseudouridine synthase [Chitinophaga sp. GCM10012297]|uniref:Pseudouridine synthase n=1 Tax=Chitinophaga chungangae TaxID=2821488 RepID=A0ABS3YH75_9BACT|nr:pseudouridine synthase [Chitinophaga chungangae]MBO9153429.1 rRNA pseudouridine synthase [Chitinophaga chungangae]
MKKSRPAPRKGFTPFKENSTGKPGEKKSRESRFGSGDDKPKRSFGDSEDLPKRKFEDREDRPKRSFGDKEFKPKRTFGDGEDRPKRKSEDREDRPRRSFGDKEFKPKRTFGDGEDRPKRKFEDREERPKRSFGDKELKPKRTFGDGEESPKRKFEDRGNKEFKPRKKEKEQFGDRPRKSERKAEIHGKKKEKSTRKRIVKETAASETADSNEMPLNKFISHCGICSRRKAVDYIKEGKVLVNGEKIIEPAFKVTAKDEVKLNDKRIFLQKNLVYVLLNKPKGYITTTDDPEGRQTVMELVEDAIDEERLFPVGRLDRNTSGLLLLTNDGELAQKLAHPKHNIKKIYHVELDKPLTKADFEKIIAGVTLEDGLALVDALGYVDSKDKKQIGIEIHSGKNRIVRRIFEHLEYKVEKLDRVMYAGLTKKNVNRGKWRFLTEKEVILLKHFK